MKNFLILITIFFTGVILLFPAVSVACDGACKTECAATDEHEIPDDVGVPCAEQSPPLKCCASGPVQSVAPTTPKTPPKAVSLDNPIGVGANPSQIIGLVIKSFLGLVGGLALVMMVWGGFQWLTSAGNPEKVKKGTSTMMWAIIGLILVLGSYVLVGTILGFLSGGGA